MRSVTGKVSKFDAFVDKLKKESPIHISKRMDAPKWLPIVIRIAAVVVAFLVCAIVTVFFEPTAFGTFFTEMFKGTFGTERRVINLFWEAAILLLIALAVTPAFKMKFWNIGAEGQVLMGSLMSATCIFYLGGKMSEGGLIVLCLLASMVGGAIWTLIPALFKAKWNTNETLFTLMLNYIATAIISTIIAVWVKTGSHVMGIMPNGHLPKIGGEDYILNILIVALITVLVWVYLKFSKHGYELSVVGESINTAKYIGISVPKVIIRTMILSGALCGVAGWLLVNGASYTINTTLAAGRGFTAILVSWLGHFDPLTMVITSFLVAFMGRGAAQVSTIANIGGSFADIVTSVFFFIIIASEFFVNYKVKFSFSHSKKKVEGETTQNTSEDDSSDAEMMSDTSQATDSEAQADEILEESSPELHRGQPLAAKTSDVAAQNKEVTE